VCQLTKTPPAYLPPLSVSNSFRVVYSSSAAYTEGEQVAVCIHHVAHAQIRFTPERAAQNGIGSLDWRLVPTPLLPLARLAWKHLV